MTGWPGNSDCSQLSVAAPAAGLHDGLSDSADARRARRRERVRVASSLEQCRTLSMCIAAGNKVPVRSPRSNVLRAPGNAAWDALCVADPTQSSKKVKLGGVDVAGGIGDVIRRVRIRPIKQNVDVICGATSLLETYHC